MIDEDGLSVLPITSLVLTHKASTARVSTGMSGLDEMLEGKGFFRGSSVLVSGTAGSGKSSVAAKFADAACARGENCVYFAFEESPDQIVRNMHSVGLDLGQWVTKNLLHFHAVRPTSTGLEGHLAGMQKLIKRLKPSVVVVDPITSIVSVSGIYGVKSMLTRLVDFLKVQQITSLFTNLTFGSRREESSEEGVSSLMDAWIVLWEGEQNGQRNRGLLVVKSRGMAHSREVRELVVSGKRQKGIDLGGVLTGIRQDTTVAG
jgi:circadian clock protein KaiC